MRGETCLSLTDLRELCAHFGPECALGKEIHDIMNVVTRRNILSRSVKDHIKLDFACYLKLTGNKPVLATELFNILHA